MPAWESSITKGSGEEENRVFTEKDAVFLRDYMEFGYLNHFVTALALVEGAKNASELGVISHEELEFMSHNDAVRQEQSLRTGARVQGIMVSRLFAEYVSTIEDFGAFLHAIRRRRQGNKGVFVKYLDSEVNAVADFFDYVLKNSTLDLGQMLELPTIDKLKIKLSADKLHDIENHYHDFAKVVVDLAKSYREKSVASSADISTKTVPTDWIDNVYTVLELSPSNGQSAETDTKPLMTEAFNKIKHRFMIIEMLDVFLNAEPKDTTLRVAYQSRRPEWALGLLKTIGGIVMYQAEIAATVLGIHKAGVKL